MLDESDSGVTTRASEMKSKGKALICRGVITLCGSSRIAFRVIIVKKQLVRKAYKLKSRIAPFKNSNLDLKAELLFMTGDQNSRGKLYCQRN
jgi:hypothetical protein